MPLIYTCDFVPPELPKIDPIEAPLPFKNIIHFETWLRTIYIPRTLTARIIDDPRLPYLIDVNKTECWGIFSSYETCEKCCQVYPETNLQEFPEFEEFLRGKIFSHNHSSNTTLSTGEVILWANLQMKEFRAVTQNGTFVIKPINQRWPIPERLAARINSVCETIISENPTCVSGELRHRCYQILADEGMFEYEFVEVNRN
jgi:hypothetical protein